MSEKSYFYIYKIIGGRHKNSKIPPATVVNVEEKVYFLNMNYTFQISGSGGWEINFFSNKEIRHFGGKLVSCDDVKELTAQPIKNYLMFYSPVSI